jgi:hypothetical protein
MTVLKGKEPRTSNCCGAGPLFGEIYADTLDGRRVYTGRCSKCKDGAEFVTDEEFDEWLGGDGQTVRSTGIIERMLNLPREEGDEEGPQD